MARQLIGQEAGIGMAVAGVDEARLLVVHDLVEGVEIRKRIDRGLVERWDERVADSQGRHRRCGRRRIGHGKSPERLATRNFASKTKALRRTHFETVLETLASSSAF